MLSVVGMIVADNLTKSFGAKTAVSGVSFAVRPGRVTGFLGPNGAGKSTTMRMIVGLDRPTSGSVTVNGLPYRDVRSPLSEVGVLLDANAAHPGRSARNHLRSVAATHGIGKERIDEVTRLVGLESVADKRLRTFSLGMRQRLGIATALLGDPQILVLDEPVNGLDPEGVRWVRELLRGLAAEGRTVLLSSHLMSEMSQTADHLIVLGRGEVLADAPTADLIRDWTIASVFVRTPRLDDLAAALSAPGVVFTRTGQDAAEVTGITIAAVADFAASHGIPMHELTMRSGSLEDAYLALTGDSIEYTSKGNS